MRTWEPGRMGTKMGRQEAFSGVFMTLFDLLKLGIHCQLKENNNNNKKTLQIIATGSFLPFIICCKWQ
jgi:hypothetical protein